MGATLCSKFCIFNIVQYMIGSTTPLLRGLNIKSFINFLVVSLGMHLVKVFYALVLNLGSLMKDHTLLSIDLFLLLS